MSRPFHRRCQLILLLRRQLRLVSRFYPPMRIQILLQSCHILIIEFNICHVFSTSLFKVPNESPHMFPSITSHTRCIQSPTLRLTNIQFFFCLNRQFIIVLHAHKSPEIFPHQPLSHTYSPTLQSCSENDNQQLQSTASSNPASHFLLILKNLMMFGTPTTKLNLSHEPIKIIAHYTIIVKTNTRVFLYPYLN